MVRMFRTTIRNRWPFRISDSWAILDTPWLYERPHDWPMADLMTSPMTDLMTRPLTVSMSDDMTVSMIDQDCDIRAVSHSCDAFLQYKPPPSIKEEKWYNDLDFSLFHICWFRRSCFKSSPPINHLSIEVHTDIRLHIFWTIVEHLQNWTI